jgi:hypothetical protein
VAEFGARGLAPGLDEEVIDMLVFGKQVSHDTVLRRAALVLSAIVFASCDTGGGPCIHTYRSPIVEVRAARQAGSSAAIARVVLRGLAWNGVALDPSQMTYPPAHGVVVEGDSILCDVPCGFATQDGEYTATVTAPGFRPKSLAVTARYALGHGGCPSWNDGGTEVEIELQPVSASNNALHAPVAVAGRR